MRFLPVNAAGPSGEFFDRLGTLDAATFPHRVYLCVAAGFSAFAWSGSIVERVATVVAASDFHR